MRNDLDALMQAHNLDALLITGAAMHNPAMVYLTGIHHVSIADLIKKRGETPVLWCNPMEREEAAHTGLPTRSLMDFPMQELMKETNGDFQQAIILRYQRVLEAMGITAGRVGLYGQQEIGPAFAVFSGLQQAMPEIEFVGELGNSVLIEARATKDEDEIEHIRHMGQITTAVVGQTADFLTSHRVKDEVLVKPDGTPLMIGEVKNKINLWLMERGAENPEGTIFAIGRDAGIPHSTGNPTDLLRLGQTIVYDIYPCEAGGGYFYDFTRTWCLGYAPDAAQALYDDVRFVYDTILQEMKMGAPCRDYQIRTCELFEARGHPTIGSNPQTEEGYVHSLGHGLGLDVHESPNMSIFSKADNVLKPGVVITSEPGLYYPSRGMGVRLEDSLWVRPDGKIEVLAPYPLDLVLPMR